MNTSQQPTVGQRLLQERKQRGWSQQTLADRLGTNVQNINRWEKDKTVPQPHHREKLCEVFERSPEDLFGEPQDEELPSIWNVPHLRNLYFTGREEILTNLHTALKSKKTVALTQPNAMNGLGGIGKTQTAIEYAYRYSHEYNAVLWVCADSYETLVSHFVALADVLRLPEKNDADQSHVVAAVQHWLQQHTQWLLILDNADDLAMAYDFLSPRGHTLLTTHSQITGPNIKKIELKQMSAEEGTLFLLRRGKLIAEDAPLDKASQTQRKEAQVIYELVGGLPLALDQAAAYIEENQCSLADYLSLYQQRRTTLLSRRGIFNQRDY